MAVAVPVPSGSRHRGKVTTRVPTSTRSLSPLRGQGPGGAGTKERWRHSPLPGGPLSPGGPLCPPHGRLVVDAHLETAGPPVHELDAALGLDGSNGGLDIPGHHVPALQQAARHVRAVPRVALHRLVGWLEAGAGDLRHCELLVVSLLGRGDGGVGVHTAGTADPNWPKECSIP